MVNFDDPVYDDGIWFDAPCWAPYWITPPGSPTPDVPSPGDELTTARFMSEFGGEAADHTVVKGSVTWMEEEDTVGIGSFSDPISSTSVQSINNSSPNPYTSEEV